MILLLVIPVYLMLNVYVFMRTFMWIRSIVKVSHHKIIGAIYFVIYAFFAVSLLSAFVLPQDRCYALFTYVYFFERCYIVYFEKEKYTIAF